MIPTALKEKETVPRTGNFCIPINRDIETTDEFAGERDDSDWVLTLPPEYARPLAELLIAMADAYEADPALHAKH